jgi:ubiquinone/menaquinone biosynthesis C-methylase UbiE
MVDFLDPQPQDVALDVAAGTGHLAKAIASRTRHVVALDLTPEMLDEGGREAEREGLKNVKFVYGDAENLPFADGVFDLVTSRFAVHHLTDPSAVVSEMVRACRFGGKVALIDLVAPAGEAEAASYNRLERLRDPSHVRALSPSELRRLLQEGGLTRTRTTSRDVEVDVERWLTLSATPPARTREIRKDLEADIAGVARTGMRPFARGGVLKFTQTWVIALGDKAG